jgi:hypothetical protein
MNADAEVQKMVTFRIAKEEFAFNMEHVREILRVQTPNQVPDVPDYVLGVLTVRGQILPVIDLRRLLQQRSLADEFADKLPAAARGVRALDRADEKLFAGDSHSKVDASVTERLRKWIAETNSSSQSLMEDAGKGARAERNGHQAASARERSSEECGDRDAARACGEEVLSAGRETVAACAGLSSRSLRTSRKTSASSWWMPRASFLGWWWITFTKC